VAHVAKDQQGSVRVSAVPPHLAAYLCRLAVAVLVCTAGCLSSRSITTTPNPTIAARLGAADALVRAGCFDCLGAAFQEYQALRSVPDAPGPATIGAARASALMAIRAREMGLDEGTYLERAREIISDSRADSEAMKDLFEIAELLPSWGFGHPFDLNQDKNQLVSKNRAAYIELLGRQPASDPLSAYLSVAFGCIYARSSVEAGTEGLTPPPDWRETALIKFRVAICHGYNEEALGTLLGSDARFIETNYFMGLSEFNRGNLDDSVERFQAAFTWQPRWPAVTEALGKAYLMLEEYERSLECFDRTLSLKPDDPDALLGKVRSLAYLGRFGDSVDAVDQLLSLERWYVGDARYWRAFDEVQLGDDEAAWNDIELSSKLLVNAQVPKLAGIIASRGQQLDIAQAKFEESHLRNPRDCETSFYLGLVLGEQSEWNQAIDVFMSTARCLEEEEQQLNDEIRRIRAANAPPERQIRQIASRESEIVNDRRMLVTSWFNAAVGDFALARNEDARELAEKVRDDAEFGERARDLLARIR
jgi:tetratricopeptide (TPR) repeat protein